MLLTATASPPAKQRHHHTLVFNFVVAAERLRAGEPVACYLVKTVAGSPGQCGTDARFPSTVAAAGAATLGTGAGDFAPVFPVPFDVFKEAAKSVELEDDACAPQRSTNS